MLTHPLHSASQWTCKDTRICSCPPPPCTSPRCDTDQRRMCWVALQPHVGNIWSFLSCRCPNRRWYLSRSACPSVRGHTGTCSLRHARSSSRRWDTGSSRRRIGAVLKNTKRDLTVFLPFGLVLKTANLPKGYSSNHSGKMEKKYNFLIDISFFGLPKYG